MQLYVIIEVLGIDSHWNIGPRANKGDEIVSADYSDRGRPKVRAHYEREDKRRYVFECCGIIGVRDVAYKVRSPIPHIDCKGILERLPYAIWYQIA
jgi:hypothetical protein